MSIPQGSPLLESGCKSTRFSDTLQIYSTIFLKFFGKEKINRWNITKWRDIFLKNGRGGEKGWKERHIIIFMRAYMCARREKRRKRARRIYTEVFRTFLYHLSPETMNIPVHRGLRHGDRLPVTYHRTCHLSPAYHRMADDGLKNINNRYSAY